MKKGIVIGLLALAIIVLVSPGVLGKMAESYVEQSNEWTASGLSGSGMDYESVSFDGGWFTSESVDRLSFSDVADVAELVDALGLDDASQLPSLVISTRFDHGLIPVTSLSRDGGSLAPALARTASTISFEAPGGGRVDIPGDIYGHIGLGGTIYSDLKIEAGSKSGRELIEGMRDSMATLGLKGDLADELNNPDELSEAEAMVFTWDEITLDSSIAPKNGRVRIAGGGDGWSVENDSGFVRVGAFTVNSDQTPNDLGIALGDFGFSVVSLEVQDSGKPGGTFGPIKMEGSTSANGGRIDADSQVYFVASEVPGVGSASMTMDLAITNLDGKSLKLLSEKLNTMQDGVSEEEMFAMLEPDLRALLSAGFAIDMKQLDIELPQGTINSAIMLNLPETDAAAFTWADILRAMGGSASLSVPEPMMDMALAMNPQAQMVVGMGFLKKNGANYEMDAQYENGLLTVNGAPFPLPMPQ